MNYPAKLDELEAKQQEILERLYSSFTHIENSLALLEEYVVSLTTAKAKQKELLD